MGILAMAILSLWTCNVYADFGLNLPQGVTPTSHAVYQLHMQIFLICVVIALAVSGILLYSMIRHRKSRHATAAQFKENRILEIVWTIIPILVLIGMAVPATNTLIGMSDTSQPDLTIKITGYQWKWRYDYLDENIGFFSNLATSQEAISDKAAKDENYLREVDNPLVVPIHKKIRFLTTANDVIHSWWVPELGMKKDALPGFINDFWARIEKPGIYRGQCTELCGKGHGFMPIVVVAKTEADYQQWLADFKQVKTAQAKVEKEAKAKTWTLKELLPLGQAVFEKICAACHQPTGVGIPGVFPPLKGSAVATGPLPAHITTVLNGRPNTAMQAFGPQLSDLDLAAVITYERNAFGNDTGDAVQPKDIAAAREAPAKQ